MSKIFVRILLVMVCVASGLLAGPPGPQPQTLSGRLSTHDGRYFLRYDSPVKTVEVHGDNLQRWVGKSVQVTGTLSESSSGVGVLTASAVGPASPVTPGAAGSKAAAAGVKSGLSKAAVIGITGGASAATVGTLYATDVLGGGGEEPASRP